MVNQLRRAIYRNYKGGLYAVLGWGLNATNSANDQQLYVAYVDYDPTPVEYDPAVGLPTKDVYFRELNEFFESVTVTEGGVEHSRTRFELDAPANRARGLASPVLKPPAAPEPRQPSRAETLMEDLAHRLESTDENWQPEPPRSSSQRGRWCGLCGKWLKPNKLCEHGIRG